MIKFKQVKQCPLCGSRNQNCKVKIQSKAYWSSGREILFPINGIDLIKCGNCNLVYKNQWLDDILMDETNNAQLQETWSRKLGYDMAKYTNIIEKMSPKVKKIIDIGSGSQYFAKIAGNLGYKVDVHDTHELNDCEQKENARHFVCSIQKLGELADIKYDLITMFDVIEHLTTPLEDMQALKMCLEDHGKILIETGNAEKSMIELSKWWYMLLPEHNIAWNKSSIEYITNKLDAELLIFKATRHKSRHTYSKKKIMITYLVSFVSEILSRFPFIREKASYLLKQEVSRFGSPRKDHFIAVIEKK